MGWWHCEAQPEVGDLASCCDGLEEEQAHMVKSSGRLLGRGFGKCRGCFQARWGVCTLPWMRLLECVEMVG